MSMSKCRKRPWNLYKYKNSLLKTYFSLIIEYGMYLKCLQKRVNLAALLVQNKPSAPIRRVENKVEFLDRQFHSEKLLFVHKKETEHSFELSLSICVFYRRIFNLESKTLVYKTTTWWTRASHFVDGWHLLRCQIRFFPHPLNGWHDHWTFVGEWGMGDYTDLVCIGEEFFPKPLWS